MIENPLKYPLYGSCSWHQQDDFSNPFESSHPLLTLNTLNILRAVSMLILHQSAVQSHWSPQDLDLSWFCERPSIKDFADKKNKVGNRRTPKGVWDWAVPFQIAASKIL